MVYHCIFLILELCCPSGIDAMGWRRLCTAYRSSPILCSSMTSIARRLCTSYVHPSSLSAFTASRLIALDKHPGVRPIGIGEGLFLRQY